MRLSRSRAGDRVLAIANFWPSLSGILFARIAFNKAGGLGRISARAPKCAREARALPGTSVRAAHRATATVESLQSIATADLLRTRTSWAYNESRT